MSGVYAGPRLGEPPPAPKRIVHTGFLVRGGRRLGELIDSVPRAGRICFAVAFINAAIWGLVIPPFQVPDEVAHFGYAQYFAETGKPPPQGDKPAYSPQEQVTLNGLYFFNTIGRPQLRGVLSGPEDDALRAALAAGPSPVGEGGTDSITNQPPLYYAAEAAVYRLSPSSNILTRLAFMRLLSAFLAACTVLAVFMFMRELFPNTRWAWTAGALVAAFQPTFDFISAGVQGDTLLYLTSALSFTLLLRAYRRGLTMSCAAAIGAVTAAGLLAKLTFIGLVPGIALAVALLTWRERSRGRGSAIRLPLVAGLVAGAPVVLYLLLNSFAWHRSGGATAGGLAGATATALPNGTKITMRETLDYTWELYLPRLWFMHHAYFATYPGWITWLDGLVGHFGWLDYTFPIWVYEDALDIFYGLSGLAILGLVRLRSRLLGVLPIFVCFGVMALGVLGEIGYAGLRYRLNTGSPFEQGRYLLPMLVFWSAFVVLAARGAGRRWAPALAAVFVVAAMAHGLFAETLTIARYYG